ncbi:MAG: hypothetical protein HDS59_00595 [Barnesiella sp.]|nr:hypothetical protein [Barnesiella sp.]
MAVQNIAQLKKWFKKGAYPTESQFADLIDSFRHRNDKVELAEVNGLSDALNKKYDASEGRILETMVARHTVQIDWLNTVQERQAEEIDELEETDEAQQIEINTAKNDILKISDILNKGGSLDDTKAALEALGENYAGLYALAVTVKTFLEANDTKNATINTWQEIESFLQGITDTESLAGLLAELEANITAAYNAAIAEAMKNGDGGISMLDVCYNDLVALRDAGELTPGSYYRITDYETTVVNDDSVAVECHYFDLVVTALDSSTLSEEAKVVRSERDTDGYFSDSHLESWRVWYCLDNDTNRFAWADSENGRGVIYRMVDEWGNDCPYDFKNIVFKRYYCGGYNLDRNDFLYDGYGQSYSHNRYLLGNGERSWLVDNDISILDYDDIKWFYTFSLVDRDGNIEDASFNSGSFRTYRNVIKPACATSRSDGGEYMAQFLNDIVLTAYSDYWDGCEDFTNICRNHFDCDCYSITIHGGSQSNKFGRLCRWIGGYTMRANFIGCDCEDIAFGYGCINNHLQGKCDNILLELGCECNKFDMYCSGHYLRMGCCSNSFGRNSFSIDLGENCFGNTFAEDCMWNSLGSDCRDNHFGGYAQYNGLGSSCENNIFYTNAEGNNLSSNCMGNKFGREAGHNTLGYGCVSNSFEYGANNNYLDNMCEGNKFGYLANNNILRGWCYNNSFGYSSNGNVLGLECYYNHLGDYHSGSQLDNYCSSNVFGANCSGNHLGEYSSGNRFGNNCENNTLDTECKNNEFANLCSSNRLISMCYSNAFGISCSGNTFQLGCSGNQLGAYCKDNQFDMAVRGGVFGSNVSKCSFGNYIDNITVGCGVEMISVTGGTSTRSIIKALNILPGVHGTASEPLTVEPSISECCQYVGQTRTGELRIWFPADLI